MNNTTDLFMLLSKAYEFFQTVSDGGIKRFFNFVGMPELGAQNINYDRLHWMAGPRAKTIWKMLEAQNDESNNKCKESI